MKRSPYIIKLILPALLFLVSFCIHAYGQTVTGFSPQSISAGTGSQLTITGSGFGGSASSTNFVEFPDADDGGASFIKPLLTEYISWSDNQIVIRVPSSAGTGQFRVVNGATTISSVLSLKVTYNILTVGPNPRRHINTNTNGGYTFQFENGFNGNAAAKTAFRKSLQAWTCQSNINWSIGTVTNVNSAGLDGTNVVRFDVDSELPAGVLGVAYIYSSLCGGSNWQITETDIVFDKERAWHYSNSDPGPSETDFQSVALHELGHAHNLGHVIDNSDVMNFAIAAGTSRRVFTNENKDASIFQVDLSKVSPGGACLSALIPELHASCSFPFPVIDSISPESAGKNGTINIIGENLSGTSFVSLGGTSAESFTVKSDKLIEVLVATGFTGEVLVTTPGGIVAYNNFTYLEPPDIISFNPKFGFTGDTISLEGFNFSGITALSFGGVPAASFSVIDNQHAKGVVAGGQTGSIILSTAVGTDSISGFTFTGNLSIQSVQPLKGITGDTITINGANFREIQSVKFGGLAAASFRVESETRIIAVLGIGSSGSVDVASIFGTASFAGFIHIPPPQIASFSPDRAAGGAPVTIKGVNFMNATEVSFGGSLATSFVINSATQITAIVGDGASGAVSLKTPGGTASKDGFTFIETLRISSFNPKIATTEQKIVITGSKFRNVIDVSFGGSPAKSFIVDSPGQISAIVGQGASGQITIRTSDGTISVDGFKFLLPPTISYFTPQSAGLGTTVHITGTNLDGLTSVQFGDIQSATFKILSATAIEAIVGTGSSGMLRVSSPAGIAELKGFTFIPLPVISSVDPLLGGKGSEINIYGANFLTTHTVSIGNKAVTSFKVLSATHITAYVGEGASDGKIVVSTLGGSGSFDGFRFIFPPTISTFLPREAIAGVSVLISGTNLGDVKGVSFGGKAAASFSILSPTSISAVVAAGSASGNISLTSPGGQAIKEGFTFIYTLPTNNFSVSATGLSCRGTMNGIISVKTLQTLNYTATITGNGQNNRYDFSNTLELKNLSPGVYQVCFTISTESTFKQCFEVVVSEPKDLAMYSFVNKEENKLNLKLEGSDTYFVELNGELTKTSLNELQLSLKSGLNKVKVYTDKLCQGMIERTFFMDAVQIFPNPFDTELNLVLGSEYWGTIKVGIMNMGGKLIYSKDHQPEGGILKLYLQDLAPGPYLLQITSGEHRTVRKILRR
ncbi:MAG: IPT/TIG domain-containing protein [Daejeonella sp.]|uniref:IPT/TIG domain-containing protein n=1 Tax=Daejeonella sp. TaxID=2805397 RepID=UPI00273740D5|nr:IPT/TIG domain-containing protein [Daejeonella sp.]MDP3468568.1 IPT/TIG domain-containing protein [Daejeonella sp.]